MQGVSEWGGARGGFELASRIGMASSPYPLRSIIRGLHTGSAKWAFVQYTQKERGEGGGARMPRADWGAAITTYVHVHTPTRYPTPTHHATAALRTLRPDVDTGLAGADLNVGYPEAWVRKSDPDDAVPVEVIVYGAQYGGVPMDRTSVVTFRNK